MHVLNVPNPYGFNVFHVLIAVFAVLSSLALASFHWGWMRSLSFLG